jgi:hypothetical protein
MISQPLLHAIFTAAAVLTVLELLRWLIERAIVRKFYHDSAIVISFWGPLVIGIIFLVMLPAIIYALLYPVLPFTSYRAGFFVGLFIFAVGVLPVQVRSNSQIRKCSGLTAFQLMWTLLTLLAVLGTLTYIYHY